MPLDHAVVLPIAGLGSGELLIFFGVAVWVVLAVLIGRTAERRGRSFAGWCLASLLFSWLLVLAVLIVLPRKDEDVGAWGVTTGPDSFSDDD